MVESRRRFLKHAGLASTLLAVPKTNAASATPIDTANTNAMLYDAVRCIGCRSCEKACNEENKLPQPLVPFDNDSVYKAHRDTDTANFTVVNKYESQGHDPVFRKEQCMHCRRPACVSACLVGALNKTPEGAVVWDEWKCIGCRYCILACPFQMLKYELQTALTPRMRKCTFCHSRLAQGKSPACFEACPAEAITFGKRDALLVEARERINKNPGIYIRHIYGENEIGGTAKLYLSGLPFDKVHLQPLADKAVPELTEAIQHGVFNHFIPPLALFAALFGFMKFFKPKDKDNGAQEEDR